MPGALMNTAGKTSRKPSRSKPAARTRSFQVSLPTMALSSASACEVRRNIGLFGKALSSSWLATHLENKATQADHRFAASARPDQAGGETAQSQASNTF